MSNRNDQFYKHIPFLRLFFLLLFIFIFISYYVVYLLVSQAFTCPYFDTLVDEGN